LQLANPDLIFYTAVYLVASGFILGFILVIFLIIMHNILYPRLDPILFKEPWFNPAQLEMFSAWPLSLIKTVIYMFLIAYPNLIRKKKRFKNLKEVPPVEPNIKIACKIYTTLHLMFVSIGVAFILLISGFYIINTWFT